MEPVKLNINSSILGNKKKTFKSKHHEHFIVYMNSKEKNYHSGSWFCDICSNNYGLDDMSMHCKSCEWDICDNCFFQDFEYVE
jgi:hypothetical protein